MKKMKYGLLGFILLLLACLLFLILNGVRQKSFNFVVKETLRKADIHIGGFSFFQTEGGRKEWELQARKAELFENENRAVIEDIHVIIHTKKGLEISFRGDEGVLDTKGKNFHIQNKKSPIQIVLSNGYRIEVMEADWNNEEKEIVSESPIVLYGGNWSARGKGLILKTVTEEFIIKRDIEAQVNS
jgi:LPS export ABC transporter protein LptC